MTGSRTPAPPFPDDSSSDPDRRWKHRLIALITELLSRTRRRFTVRHLDLIEKTALTVAVVTFLCWVPGDAALALTPGMKAVATLPQVINNATAWVVGILATVGTFFFTVGGLRYMAANGDPAEIEKAKGAFRGAGVGFGLAMLAPVFMNILQKILGT